MVVLLKFVLKLLQFLHKVAETAATIDIARAKKAAERAEAALQAKKDETDYQNVLN